MKPTTTQREKSKRDYKFDDEQMKQIDEFISHYPKKFSAVLHTLYIAQDAFGEINPDVIDLVAEVLEVAPAKVNEVFHFYTFFRRPGCGKYRIDVCSTLSCALRGSEELADHLQKKLGVGLNETTEDGKFTIAKVECIAACGYAPAVQINGDYHEHLTVEKLDEIIDSLD